MRRVDKQIAQGTDQEQEILVQMDDMQHRIVILDQMVREQDKNIASLQNTINLSETEIADRESEMAGIGSEILSFEAREQDLAAAVARTMLASRRLAGWALLDFLLGAQTWPELLSRRSTISRLEKAGRSSLTSLKASSDTLKEREDDLYRRTQELRLQKNILTATRQEAAALERTIQSDLSDLTEGKRSLRAQLQKVRKNRWALKAQREDLSLAQKEIEDIISKVNSGEPLEGISLILLKGSLPWPLAGTVVQKFGLVRNRNSFTLTENPGIELEADNDTEVTAIAEGKVSSVSWLRGYGNVCIIEHPGSYYSVYAKLGQVNVKAGDKVSMSQVIGYPGYDVSSEKYRLHFELWAGKIKKDPLQWLKQQ